MTATVLLVGTEDLPVVPEYLRLGAVVVIAPDRDTLRRWQLDTGETPPSAPPAGTETVLVDFPGRRVLVDDAPLELSELEFRVLAALLSRPGRAWSFTDLRRAGWGEGPRLVGDVEALRALIQRVRRKLGARRAPVRLAAVRGYGYRAEVAGSSAPASGEPAIEASGPGAA